MAKIKILYIFFLAAIILMTLDLGVQAKTKISLRHKITGFGSNRSIRTKPIIFSHTNTNHKGPHSIDLSHLNTHHRSTSHLQLPLAQVHVPTGGHYVPPASALPPKAIYIQQLPSGYSNNLNNGDYLARAMYREYRRQQRREERTRRREQQFTLRPITTTPAPSTAPDNALYGVICVPIKVKEHFPRHTSHVIERKRTICYPAPASAPASAPTSAQASVPASAPASAHTTEPLPHDSSGDLDYSDVYIP